MVEVSYTVDDDTETTEFAITVTEPEGVYTLAPLYATHVMVLLETQFSMNLIEAS